MDNEEFQDSTSNLTNTDTELNNTQQGYIKAITKLVRSIERANHHIQLLKIDIDKKAPPRGLIPKISPKFQIHLVTSSSNGKAYNKKQDYTLLKHSKIIGQTEQTS